MNLQQCRYVEAIARCGSFNRAAKELFVSQPNLSSSIKDLEKELGAQLFIRSNMGVKLTEDGFDFLKYAKRILGEMDLLERRYQSNFRKSFTIASHHYDFLSLPLAKVAELYKEEYREFQLVETSSKQILDHVANFEADLGILYLDAENRHIIERSLEHLDLQFHLLGDFPTRIFLRKGHPLAQKASLSKQDLEGYNQVRFRQEKDGLHFDEDLLDVEENQGILFSNDRSTVMNLLCASDAYASGLGIVDSFIKEQIVLIPLEASPKHSLGYVTSNQKKMSAISQSFIHEVKKGLRLHLDSLN